MITSNDYHYWELVYLGFRNTAVHMKKNLCKGTLLDCCIKHAPVVTTNFPTSSDAVFYSYLTVTFLYPIQVKVHIFHQVATTLLVEGLTLTF